MAIPNKPGYTHGSTGTQPPVAIDWESGDPVDEAYFDYFIDTQFDYIKALIDALNDLDSDDDGKVDAADFADDATNATSTFKGNDIVDSNGVAFNAHQVEGADGNYHSAGSLPQFSGTSTAISNTSEGDIFYITGDNSVYMNNGGSAINLTKKYIDILINGGQEASYEQYDTNGDYDVSVTFEDPTPNYGVGVASGSYSWTGGSGGSDNYTQVDSFSFDGYVKADLELTGSDGQGDIWIENSNGTRVVDGPQTAEKLKDNTNTWTVWVEEYDPDVDGESAAWDINGDTYTKWSLPEQGNVAIPDQSLIINSISQTTSN